MKHAYPRHRHATRPRPRHSNFTHTPPPTRKAPSKRPKASRRRRRVRPTATPASRGCQMCVAGIEVLRGEHTSLTCPERFEWWCLGSRNAQAEGKSKAGRLVVGHVSQGMGVQFCCVAESRAAMRRRPSSRNTVLPAKASAT